MAFSPDGKILAAAFNGYRTHPNGGVVLWDVDSSSWVRRAEKVANRNLSLDEWRQYFPGESYRPTFLELPFPVFDEAFEDIARNLSLEAWTAFFPGKPYRKIFPDLPVAPRL